MDIESDLPWHVLPPDEALARLESSRSGLDRDEVERRLSSFGPNSLPPPKTTHPALRFLAQFNSALIYFLLAAAVAAGVLDRKSTRLNSSHYCASRMPSFA